MYSRLMLVLALSLSVAAAAPVQYRIAQELQNLHIVTVESETDLENFTGRTNDVSGTLTFDPVARTGSGTLVVDGKSLTTGIALRDEHMKSKDWLNFDALPNITFVSSSVRFLRGTEYEVKGRLTMNGKTLPVTARSTVRLTPANEVTQSMGLKGNALAMTTRFKVKLSDFGVVHPAVQAGRVNNTLEVVVRAIASDK